MSAHPNAPHSADASPNTTHLPGHARRTIGTIDGVTVAIRNVDKVDGFAGRRFIVVAHNGEDFGTIGLPFTREAEALIEARAAMRVMASIVFAELVAA
jgi:hypothetical protein